MPCAASVSTTEQSASLNKGPDRVAGADEHLSLTKEMRDDRIGSPHVCNL
ncbi:hypothetical protein VAWG001_14710 [Aeromonas dhakensis]|nr:hypothetical protein VAWG001_14710 [Aeromonas dhakensis]